EGDGEAGFGFGDGRGVAGGGAGRSLVINEFRAKHLRSGAARNKKGQCEDADGATTGCHGHAADGSFGREPASGRGHVLRSPKDMATPRGAPSPNSFVWRGH